MTNKLEQMCEYFDSHYRSNKLELAARQALEALEWHNASMHRQKSMDAIIELREALNRESALHREGFWCEDLTCAKCYSAEFRLKHTAPVRTKDLTDDEIGEIFSKYASDLYKARAVIAADREKNNVK